MLYNIPEGKFEHHQMTMRLSRELRLIAKSNPYQIQSLADQKGQPNFSAEITINNIKHNITLFIPHEYPFKPPMITFINHIVHPLIYKSTFCRKLSVDYWHPKYFMTPWIEIVEKLLNDSTQSHSCW